MNWKLSSTMIGSQTHHHFWAPENASLLAFFRKIGQARQCISHKPRCLISGHVAALLQVNVNDRNHLRIEDFALIRCLRDSHICCWSILCAVELANFHLGLQNASLRKSSRLDLRKSSSWSIIKVMREAEYRDQRLLPGVISSIRNAENSDRGLQARKSKEPRWYKSSSMVVQRSITCMLTNPD